jgi:hypothetical protein
MQKYSVDKFQSVNFKVTCAYLLFSLNYIMYELIAVQCILVNSNSLVQINFPESPLSSKFKSNH